MFRKKFVPKGTLFFDIPNEVEAKSQDACLYSPGSCSNNRIMLKTRAIERFLSQVVDNEGGVTGIMLFNKEGMALARTGKAFTDGNVYAALLSNIWETFEQQAVRDELSEMTISCEMGTVMVIHIASMLLAITSDGTTPVGQLKVKLQGLSEHLGSLSVIT